MNNTRRHIFFVDDNLKVPKVVVEALKQLDTAITCFFSASDCLEELCSRKCDLLITDLRMPGSEQRVLKLVLDGRTNREIAGLLSRSQRTIESHRSQLMHKLCAENLVDLVKRVTMMGLIETPEGRNKKVEGN